jgi:hypothetical protein
LPPMRLGGDSPGLFQLRRVAGWRCAFILTRAGRRPDILWTSSGKWWLQASSSDGIVHRAGAIRAVIFKETTGNFSSLTNRNCFSEVLTSGARTRARSSGREDSGIHTSRLAVNLPATGRPFSIRHGMTQSTHIRILRLRRDQYSILCCCRILPASVGSGSPVSMPGSFKLLFAMSTSPLPISARGVSLPRLPGRLPGEELTCGSSCLDQRCSFCRLVNAF